MVAKLASAWRVGRLEALEALLDSLAALISEKSNSLAKAPLAREYREALKEREAILNALPEAGSIVDELTERRDAARLAASGDAETAGGGR